MDFNTDVRRVQLESLEQFIAASKEKVRSVLEALNWESDKVLQDNDLLTCSLDPNHKIPQKSAAKHIKKCTLRKEGYDLKEPFLSEPQHHPHSTIVINNHKKIEILSEAHKTRENFRSRWNAQDPDPRTAERLTTTYSSDERLVLYDYAVSMTKGPDKLPEYNVSQPKRDESKSLTYEEQLALERDAKRRRIKYKSVHTSRKTHTEVLREVIDSQMEAYKDWLCTKTSKRDEEDREGRSTSRNSSNSSRSTLKKDMKRERECSDTDSASKSRRSSVERNKRERSKDSFRSFKERRSEDEEQRLKDKELRRRKSEGHRRREDDGDRRYEYKDESRYWDRSRNQSKDYDKSRERRNGYKSYCS